LEVEYWLPKNKFNLIRKIFKFKYMCNLIKPVNPDQGGAHDEVKGTKEYINEGHK